MHTALLCHSPWSEALNCMLIASIVKEGLVNYFLGINRLDRIGLLTPRLFGFRQSSVISRALLSGYFVVLVWMRAVFTLYFGLTFDLRLFSDALSMLLKFLVRVFV